MTVGEFRRGGHIDPRRSGSLTPRQPLLTAEQVEAVRLSIGANTGFAASLSDPLLKATFAKAAATLQAMLDADARAKAR